MGRFLPLGPNLAREVHANVNQNEVDKSGDRYQNPIERAGAAGNPQKPIHQGPCGREYHGHCGDDAERPQRDLAKIGDSDFHGGVSFFAATGANSASSAKAKDPLTYLSAFVLCYACAPYDTVYAITQGAAMPAAKKGKPHQVVLSVRLEPQVKTALEKAAKADSRNLTSLVQKIVAEWLKAQGHLKP
jgi:hypothetical protein